jgi:hypothetical protein
MDRFNDRTLKEYFKRSYFAVDGLWFMAVGEDFSFENALDMDKRVWGVLAKIQARKVRELLGIDGNSMADLINALKLKWTAEDYEFEISGVGKNYAEVHLKGCPWLETMKKSKRGHLAHMIGEHVCGAEYTGWAGEFNPGIEFEMEKKLCSDDTPCKLKFSLRGNR